MLTTEIKRNIDSLRDTLVGKIPDPKAQVEQITIALIYKFMNDMDDVAVDLGGKPAYFVDEYAKYSWRSILSPQNGGQERVNLYMEGLEKMNENANLPQLFRDIFRGAYLPYRDPETLNLFLKGINLFSYDHSENLGDAFEYLLSVLGSQGDAGQFRTPRHIIDMMVAIVDPQKNQTVLDPACGTAGFLISAYKHILEANKNVNPGDKLTHDERSRLLRNFSGYDISPDMVRLSRVNMYLHDFPDPKIHEYDSLTSEDRWNDTFDVILANPPFMTPKGGIRPHKRFSVTANRSEVLFVDYIAEHLNPNGRAAIIVPEGIVFQSANAYKALRKYIVESNYLYAVLSLPAGVFNPYSGVKTSILLFDKALAKKTDSILFVKVENDGFDLGAQRRAIQGSELLWVVDVLKRYQLALAEGNGLKLNDSEAQRALLVKKSNLSQNDYVLTGERYKENNRAGKVKWSVVKIGEVCEVIAGQSPEGEFYNDLADGMPFYQGKTEFQDIYIGTPKKWTTQITKIAHAGDILMSVRAPVGPVNIATQDICIGRGLAAIRPNSAILSRMYVFYILRSMESVITGNAGAVFGSINKKEIESLEIPFPPLSAQDEIVAEIEGYQRVLDGARQVVENYKPNIKVDPEWPMVELGDACQFIDYRGKTPEKSAQGIRLITAKNIKEGFISDEPKEFIELDEFHRWSTRGEILENDVFFTTEAPLGNAALNIYSETIAIAQRIIALRPRNGILPEFLLLVLMTEKVKSEIFARRSGTTVFGIKASELEKIQIPVPSLEKQKDITNKIRTEQSLVRSANDLMEIMEQNIHDRIDDVWGD